ncbi:glutamate 5-kinase, partial [Enterocloster citroniae]
MEQKKIQLNEKKRVVVKIGSSSLNYEETGNLNFTKLEHLVRELCDLRNRGLDVCLVSSGAIAVGRKSLGLMERPKDISTKQACAAVGQACLMMTYQKMFVEYNQVAGQVLMTKNTIINPVSRENTKNTFEELFRLGVIPVVNENDTVSTYEMQFGDNDTLSAIVASLIGADLLILLSDIDGLFTDDPRTNPDAKLIEVVERMDSEIY